MTESRIKAGEMVDRAGLASTCNSSDLAVTTSPEYGGTSSDHPQNVANILRELKRAQCAFQLRTIKAVLGEVGR